MSLCMRFVPLAWALLMLPMAVSANDDPLEPDSAGLEVVVQGRHSEILASSEAQWSDYNAVRLDRATIEFRKNWKRDQRNRSRITIREKDEKRIKDGLADLFETVFTGELTRKGGYVMTGENGPGVLHITPRIVDLDVVAPDRARNYIGGALTDSQGRMTVELDIRDSSSGVLLASTRHYLEDWYKGYMEWTTSVTNNRAFRLMLERWADDIVDWLEAERAATGKTSATKPADP